MSGDAKFGDPRMPERWWNLIRPPERDDDCWEWRTAKQRGGYAAFVVGSPASRVKWLSHRYSYTAFRGPIPDGLVIDHLCRRPWCVNPSHLEAVAHRENTLRGNGACAVHARKTHCARGHPYDEANTKFKKSGRVCRTCERRWWKETNERRKREAADRRSAETLRG